MENVAHIFIKHFAFSWLKFHPQHVVDYFKRIDPDDWTWLVNNDSDPRAEDMIGSLRSWGTNWIKTSDYRIPIIDITPTELVAIIPADEAAGVILGILSRSLPSHAKVITPEWLKAELERFKSEVLSETSKELAT